MIGNTVEYLQANNLILQIMDMIEGNRIFNEIKPIQPSDIVNLSLYLLKILIEIHVEEGSEKSQSQKRIIEDITESIHSFNEFSDDSINSQTKQNKDLMDVLLAFGTAKDKEGLIIKLLHLGSDS